MQGEEHFPPLDEEIFDRVVARFPGMDPEVIAFTKRFLKYTNELFRSNWGIGPRPAPCEPLKTERPERDVSREINALHEAYLTQYHAGRQRAAEVA